MINPETFFEHFTRFGVEFFTGVPDSLLKDFTSYLFDHVDNKRHVITANEGAAIALATGSYLASGKPALVYFQNSGIGNAMNPLLSLADPEVYKIPMVLLIGWRGMPGTTDEPQHLKQGRIQNSLLDIMEIPFQVIGPGSLDIEMIIQNIMNTANSRGGPVALVVQKDTFSKYVSRNLNKNQQDHLMSRELAISHVLNALNEEDLVVSTTGMISREAFEIRERSSSGHHRDFLTVGSMGHCSQIALGIAMMAPVRMIYSLDGDGAFIMHMGSPAIIGQISAPNFKHIVFNNAVHDSVGGQPTAASVANLAGIARACGYADTRKVEYEKDLIDALSWLKHEKGPILLEIRVKPGARDDLGRPTRSPVENKLDFEQNLRDVVD